MRSRLILGALLLTASLACATTPRVYLVTWVAAAEASPERRALMAKFDVQLRDELRRRGATVIDKKSGVPAIVLRPSLEVTPKGLKLNMIGLRGADQKLLGSVSVKAAGSTRDAQLRAIVSQACSEADQFE